MWTMSNCRVVDISPPVERVGGPPAVIQPCPLHHQHPTQEAHGPGLIFSIFLVVFILNVCCEEGVLPGGDEMLTMWLKGEHRGDSVQCDCWNKQGNQSSNLMNIDQVLKIEKSFHHNYFIFNLIKESSRHFTWVESELQIDWLIQVEFQSTLHTLPLLGLILHTLLHSSFQSNTLSHGKVINW